MGGGGGGVGVGVGSKDQLATIILSYRYVHTKDLSIASQYRTKFA